MSTLSITRAMSFMSGDFIPKIDLRSIKYKGVLYDESTLGRIYDAVEDATVGFYSLYKENVSASHYTVEDVFDSLVCCMFESIEAFKQIDVIYGNMTIHLRIVIEGIDERTKHTQTLSKRDFITSRCGSTVVIHLEKFKTDAFNEYWEYYIAM